MKKKKDSGKCLACNERFVKLRGEKVKLYCATHFQLAKTLRSLRQPCRSTFCKNPSAEDGYCDSCRPFDADYVPFREDWLRGEGLIKSNAPNCRYRSSEKVEIGSTRCAAISTQISEIWAALNE